MTNSSISPPKLAPLALLAVADAGAAISRELILDRLFNQIAVQAADVLRAQGASVMLLCHQTKHLVFQTAVGPYAKDLVGQTFDAELGIAGRALRAHSPIRIGDAQRDESFFANIDRTTGGQTAAVIAAPMFHDDEAIGVLEVLNPTDRPGFSSYDEQVLATLADVAASAVQLARRYDRTRQHPTTTTQKAQTKIVGNSPAIKDVIELCRKVAISDTTVLVTGQTGAGKELVVHSVHQLSARSKQPLIPVNCAALPENLLEGELFGHRKGSFTGADHDKIGLFEQAHQGTLFLDEIGELSHHVQSKLLRALEQRQITRIGDTKPIDCDVRLIAATNRDLRAQVQAGHFREDLYYRLNVFAIPVPPLRERLDDLPLLTKHFMTRFAKRNNRPVPTLTDQVTEALSKHTWPGNIRELRNTIERAMILTPGDKIYLEHLPKDIIAPLTDFQKEAPGEEHTSIGVRASMLDNQDRQIIVRTLRLTRGNLSAAARSLNVTRDLLRYRVRKYEIADHEFAGSS